MRKWSLYASVVSSEAKLKSVNIKFSTDDVALTNITQETFSRFSAVQWRDKKFLYRKGIFPAVNFSLKMNSCWVRTFLSENI